MSKPVKAAILSALVFPGAGHYSLKKYWRGLPFSALSLLSMGAIIATVIDRAKIIVHKIESGQITYDIDSINAQASALAQGGGGVYYESALTLLAITWLCALIDAYYLGYQASKGSPPPTS